MKLSDVISGPKLEPPRITIYGGAGVGKSTFAAGAPNAIFLPTEDGIGVIGADRFPLLESYDAVVEAIEELTKEDHKFQTVVIDSLDWLEPLVWKRVCDIHDLVSVPDTGFGKGYALASEVFRDLLFKLEILRRTKRMAIILIAHSAIKKHEPPDLDSFDRYELKLHKAASALVSEHSDIIGFCNYRTVITETDTGFSKKRKRAVGTGERILQVGSNPAFVAKTRYAIPQELPLNWKDLQNAIEESTK